MPHSVLPLTESGQLNIMTTNNTVEILATYTTQELEELLQFIETKEGRFENLKRQLKDELAFRLRFHSQLCLQH
jgi:NTP pyrophosphatase (non-canonical NTP hydrolase)